MAHKRLAASASSRWLLCRGSVAYIEFLKEEKRIPQETSNSASELGTAVHSIIEHAIINQINPALISKHKIKKLTEVPIDNFAINGAVMAYDWVENIRGDYDEVIAERSYDLTFRYDADIGGTSDISGFKNRGELLIADYKNGRTPVEVENNSQLRIYTLGAYHHENDWYNFKKVRNVIIQPNASHPEGRIRHETYRIRDLLEWEESVLIPAVEDISRNTASLKPGPVQCAWCEARYVCEANAKQTMQLAQIDFANIADPKPELPTPKSLTKKQLVFILDNADRIRQFLSACEQHVQLSIEHGQKVGDYQVIDKIGNRRLIDEKDFAKILRQYKIPISALKVIPEPHLMTVTQIEQFLSKDKKWPKDKIAEFMDEVTNRPVTGKTLVKAVSTAKRDFSAKC